MSIQWKPLRDSHYIVASLQPGGGGLRQIFARQSVLGEVQALARGDPGRSVVGLLLGERFDCSLTLTPYLLIESHVEVAMASLNERAATGAIRTLRGRLGRHDSLEVLGWYYASPSADLAVSRTHAAVHASCFEERWQTVLIFGDSGRAGAFYLYDGTEARWFQAPFYEVTDTTASSRATRPTCVAWPAYVTTASVVAVAVAPQEVPVPSRQASAAAPASSVAVPVLAPARQNSATFARFVVTMRRTPANAIAGVGRVAVAARRSALDVAKALGGHAVTASRHATRRIVRIRADRAARAAQRKAEAEAARARDAERRAKEAADRRAARDEAQRRAAEAEKQRVAEAEARRAAEAEARRRAAEDAERRRAAEAETRRQAAEVEARRQAEAAEEDRRRAAEAEAARQAAEAEARHVAAAAEARRLAEAEAEAQRQAVEAAARREAEAEEDARRKAAEAEEEARWRVEEAEALRISLAVAATRQRLARPPVEGSKRETSRPAAAQMADHEDTRASDGPDRYLALAMREGFEVSVKTERGSPAGPETFWLLHESESGLRLVVVTTNEAVRSASLHYNFRTEDEALLLSTAPEHRDLESRAIYAREECVHELRARCRRLRAMGTLRDWTVVPI